MAHYRTDPQTGRLIPAEPEVSAQQPSASLRNWREQRRPEFGATQRYSRFVRVMKVTLPLVAFSLVVLVVLYSTLGRDTHNFKIAYEHVNGATDDLQLKAPRLTGTDGSGQPFTVTAKFATQAPGKSQKMNFESVVGDITMRDKSWLALEATRGLMDGEAKTLDLYDTINIFTDKGYECHTTAARYDMGAGVLRGDHPINCQGPLGIITAKAFEGLKEPGLMTFSGEVSTTIFPAQRDAAAAREAADPNSAGNSGPSDAPIAPAGTAAQSPSVPQASPPTLTTPMLSVPLPTPKPAHP